MDYESGQKSSQTFSNSDLRKVRESSDSVKYTELLQNIRNLTKSIKIKKTENKVS